MKFRTRILITFFTIILLPCLLALTAFLLIGNYLTHTQEEYGVTHADYNVWIDPTVASRTISDEIFRETKEHLQENPRALEDTTFLEGLNKKISGRSSYIIVRKGDMLREISLLQTEFLISFRNLQRKISILKWQEVFIMMI